METMAWQVQTIEVFEIQTQPFDEVADRTQGEATIKEERISKKSREREDTPAVGV